MAPASILPKLSDGFSSVRLNTVLGNDEGEGLVEKAEDSIFPCSLQKSYRMAEGFNCDYYSQ